MKAAVCYEFGQPLVVEEIGLFRVERESCTRISRMSTDCTDINWEFGEIRSIRVIRVRSSR